MFMCACVCLCVRLFLCVSVCLCVFTLTNSRDSVGGLGTVRRVVRREGDAGLLTDMLEGDGADCTHTHTHTHTQQHTTQTPYYPNTCALLASLHCYAY